MTRSPTCWESSARDASFAKLIKTLQKNVFVFDLPNDADLISPLVGLLMQVISGMDLISGTELVRMGVALEHALVNAMYRGNLELGPSVTPPHRAIVYDDATTDLIEKRKASSPYQGPNGSRRCNREQGRDPHRRS